MSLLNRSAVRRCALETRSAQTRGFTRVSQGFLDEIEAKVREVIAREVRWHPSIGKTLRGSGEGAE